MSEMTHITILDHLNLILSEDNVRNAEEKGESAKLRLDLHLNEEGDLILDASGFGVDESFTFNVSEENELAIGGIMKLIARRISRESRGQTVFRISRDDANLASE